LPEIKTRTAITEILQNLTKLKTILGGNDEPARGWTEIGKADREMETGWEKTFLTNPSSITVLPHS
jgi:hypothetical protein